MSCSGGVYGNYISVKLSLLDWRAFADSGIFDRAFADFVLGSLILHFFCVNFIN